MAVHKHTYPAKDSLHKRQDELDSEELRRASALVNPGHRAIQALDETTGPIILSEHERVLLRRTISAFTNQGEAQAVIHDFISVFALRADMFYGDLPQSEDSVWSVQQPI